MMMSRRHAMARLATLAATLVTATSARAGTNRTRLAYGPHPSQSAELFMPEGSVPVPVAVVLHGGFWRHAYSADLCLPLALDLAASGFAAWNVEYRRVGAGGGWPMTLSDAADAVDALANLGQTAAGGRLDLSRVVVIGHSTGGQLAAWLASRRSMGDGAPGGPPVVPLRGAIVQAGVFDLLDAHRHGVGGNAIEAFLGGTPEERRSRYVDASPVAWLPIEVPVICLHGEADPIVPIRQSERYVAAARAVGDPAELVRLRSADHFDLINPRSRAWAIAKEAARRIVSA